MDALTKYLNRHAEPETYLARTQQASTNHQYQSALVLPAFDEPPEPIKRTLEKARAENAIVIAVINCPDTAAAAEIERTRDLFNALTQCQARHLLMVNRVDEPIPRRQGVGLARKIGADIALELFSAGKLVSPWIYSTDADAVLPDNYFQHPLGAAGAAVFAHRHHAKDGRLAKAVALYDQHMAYYVAGLSFAGSRYAMPSLGSALAIHAHTYAQIRGFPRRAAAEDFYLLNKAVKIAPVEYHPQVVIDIEARVSQRVPFGTGPALNKIAELLDAGQSYNSYDVEVFVQLKHTLAALDRFAETGRLVLHEPNLSILQGLGFAARERNFVSAYQPRQRRCAVHDWFDGLRTLKFVRALAKDLPETPLLPTLKDLPAEMRACMQSHFWGDPNPN